MNEPIIDSDRVVTEIGSVFNSCIWPRLRCKSLRAHILRKPFKRNKIGINVTEKRENGIDWLLFCTKTFSHTHTHTQPPVRTPLKHYCESGISLCTLRTSNKTNHLGYISIGVSITWESQPKRTMPSCKYVSIYTLNLCVMMAFLSFSNHHSFNCYNAFIPLHAISCQWQEKKQTLDGVVRWLGSFSHWNGTLVLSEPFEYITIWAFSSTVCNFPAEYYPCAVWVDNGFVCAIW